MHYHAIFRSKWRCNKNIKTQCNPKKIITGNTELAAEMKGMKTEEILERADWIMELYDGIDA